MLKNTLFALLIILCFPVRCYAFDISAESACLINADSGQIIYSKNPHKRLAPASTTKMMTALVAAESGKWEETVYFSKNACSQEGTRVYLEEGDSAKLGDIICAMLLNSGNDAAVATAEYLYGSEEKFAEKMTERAKKAGAVNTSFENPSGLDGEKHFSTAYDLAVIGREVLKNPLLSEIAATKNAVFTSGNGSVTYLKNHNKMLWQYEGANGIKTGYTKKAGRCLVSSASRGGVRLIAVTMHAANDWQDHKNMLDYGFEKCTQRCVLKCGTPLCGINAGGERLALVCAKDASAVCIDGLVTDCEIRIYSVSEADLPIYENEVLGYAEIIQNGNRTDTVELIADRSVKAPEKSFFSLFADIISNFAVFFRKGIEMSEYV